MIPITPQSRYDALVKLREGKIGREIFSDREIYEEELERVFTRAWLFVGHESQIPKPGDYFVSGMGEESVILCRDSRTGSPSKTSGASISAGPRTWRPGALKSSADGRACQEGHSPGS